MLTVVLLALAGLFVHDFVQWRIARWQARETARLVRLAVFGPDEPTDLDKRAVCEALSTDPPPSLQADKVDFIDEDTPAVVDGVLKEPLTRVASDALGDAVRANRLVDVLSRGPAVPASRSSTWADAPQGSARARRERPDDE